VDIGSILRGGIPAILDQVGGIADEVKVVAGTVADVKKAVAGSTGGDQRAENVAPVNVIQAPPNTTGPDLAKESDNKTLMMTLAVVAGVVVVWYLTKGK
jgi:hypothetical protein